MSGATVSILGTGGATVLHHCITFRLTIVIHGCIQVAFAAIPQKATRSEQGDSPMKSVAVMGHKFDCLPGHVLVSGHGRASNLRVACQRAIGNMLASKQLRGRRVKFFHAIFTIHSNGKGSDFLSGGE